MKIQKSLILADVTAEHAVIHFLTTHVREMGDVQRILEEIESVAYNHNVKYLILNCSRLKQLTSAFLSKLILLNNSLKQAGITLRVCSMTADLLQVFRICKLDKIIQVYDNEDKAVLG